MKFVLMLSLSLITLAGCMQVTSGDDLRGVPVTNNPNLVPKTNQTAQGPSF